MKSLSLISGKWMFFMGLNGNLESHMFNSYHIFIRNNLVQQKVVFGPCFLNHVSLISSDHFVISASVCQGEPVLCSPKFSTAPQASVSYPEKLCLKLKKQTGKISS